MKEYFNGGFSFWLFAALSMICMYFVVKFVPETKGVALEDMEQVMAEKLGRVSKENATNKASVQ